MPMQEVEKGYGGDSDPETHVGGPMIGMTPMSAMVQNPAAANDEEDTLPLVSQ